MLDSKILDFARRLIQVEIKKRQRPFFDKLSRKQRELHLCGNSPDTSSRGKKAIRNIFTEELENRASVVWESLQRAHKALGSQITGTLASDFKEAATHFLTEITKELSEFMIKRRCFAKNGTANSILYSAKNDACEKINIEIDLYVNSLTTKQAETGRNTTPAKRCGIKKIAGWIFKKTWHLIVAIIVAIIGSLIAAILIDIIGDFGLLERIKDFIYNIL